MRSPVDDTLVLAFEHAAGRSPAGIEPVARVLERFAGEVIAAGRRVLAAPACPAALLRRAATLVDVSPRGAVRAAVWKLVFDSWATAAPAARGPARPRFLRFDGRGGSLDVEMVTAESGSVRLRGTLDGPSGDLELEISPRGGSAVRVPVRAGGSFSAALEAPAAPFTLTVRAGRRPILRTGRIPPPSRA